MKKQYILMGATMVFAALFASCSQENIMDEAFSQSEKEIILNSATLFPKKQFKALSNNILPNALSCQKIHLT